MVIYYSNVYIKQKYEKKPLPIAKNVLPFREIECVTAGVKVPFSKFLIPYIPFLSDLITKTPINVVYLVY